MPRVKPCPSYGLCLCLGLLSCTGPTSVTSVGVTAGQSVLQPGQSSTLLASVLGSGDFIPDVTWSLAAGPGSLSAATSSSVLYTAPLVVAQAETASVMATSLANPDVFGSATLSLVPAADAGHL
jgi:hypothetical protein